MSTNSFGFADLDAHPVQYQNLVLYLIAKDAFDFALGNTSTPDTRLGELADQVNNARENFTSGIINCLSYEAGLRNTARVESRKAAIPRKAKVKTFVTKKATNIFKPIKKGRAPRVHRD